MSDRYPTYYTAIKRTRSWVLLSTLKISVLLYHYLLLKSRHYSPLLFSSHMHIQMRPSTRFLVAKHHIIAPIICLPKSNALPQYRGFRRRFYHHLKNSPIPLKLYPCTAASSSTKRFKTIKYKIKASDKMLRFVLSHLIR